MLTRQLRVRLYPTRVQKEVLERSLEVSRLLYNAALEERQIRYRNGLSTGLYNQTYQLKDLRRELEGFKEPCSQMMKETLSRLDTSFKNFFSGKCKYPRFRSRTGYRSMTYPVIRVQDKKLYLPKMGWIKFRTRLPLWIDGAEVRRAVVSVSSGKWYASIVYRTDVVLEPSPNNQVGLDLGLSSYVTTHDGIKIEHPRWFRTTVDRLKWEQRRLSRKKRGSQNRKKQLIRVKRAYERVTNQRKDYLHRLSRHLAKTYNHIAVEDLTLQGWDAGRLNGDIQQSGWGMFVGMLEYKVKEHGGTLVKVNPAYTTQDCSECGNRVPKTLRDRTHNCTRCGLVLDRDVNAARNILARSLSNTDLPGNPREVTSVERRSLMKQKYNCIRLVGVNTYG